MVHTQTRVVLENEMQKIHWDFEILMDDLIPAINKAKEFTVSWILPS